MKTLQLLHNYNLFQIKKQKLLKIVFGWLPATIFLHKKCTIMHKIIHHLYSLIKLAGKTNGCSFKYKFNYKKCTCCKDYHFLYNIIHISHIAGTSMPFSKHKVNNLAHVFAILVHNHFGEIIDTDCWSWNSFMFQHAFDTKHLCL